MATELDYMEYATNDAVRTAYDLDAVYNSNILTNTANCSASSEYSSGYIDDYAMDGNPTTMWSSVSTTFPEWWKYDLGSGNEKIVEYVYINSVQCNAFKIQGSNNDSDWTDIYSDSHLNQGTASYEFANSTAYRWYRILIESGSDSWASLYEIEMKESRFNAYSESTIKNQGTYSLKCLADSGVSLNKTLTRTVNPTIDLSDLEEIKLDVRSGRTGTNIQAKVVKGHYIDLTAGQTYAASASTEGTTPANAFDNNFGGTYWQNSAGGAGDWIQCQFGSARRITKLNLQCYDGNNSINGFTIKASNNGSDWTDIHTDNGVQTSNLQSFIFSNSLKYTYWRFHINSVHVSYPSITEIEMMERAEHTHNINI